MKGFVVHLREDGLFEAPAVAPGGSSVRIVYESADQRHPWVAMSLDDMGVKWRRMKGFHSLDEALDFSVSQVNWERTVCEYSVRLPDGMSFQRPGRLPAEQVMASAGWVFVTSLIGYAMVTTERNGNAFGVRAVMAKRLLGCQARIGDIDLSDADEEGLHWCIDLSLPYEGFIKVEDIGAEAKAAFAADKVDVMPHFDFRPRSNVAMTEATVIAFPEDRIVRRLTAA